MNAPVTIGKIETRPELDPYHRDTGQETRTAIKIDPERRHVWAIQDYDDNATPSDEWHHIIETFGPAQRPDEDALREYLAGEAGQVLLAAICNGHSIEWDGRNMVGRLSPEAQAAWELLEQAIEELPESEWGLWSVADWVRDEHNVTATSSDAEIETMAADYEALALSDHVALSSNVAEYLRAVQERERERTDWHPVRGKHLTILVTPDERQRYHIAARWVGRTLSDMVREYLERWAAEILGP